MKLIDGHALAERLQSDAITTDQRRQANMIAKVIEEMPEVRPERKTGRWIYGAEGTFGNPYGHYDCSMCGQRLAWKEKFCPNCGADMRTGGLK